MSTPSTAKQLQTFLWNVMLYFQRQTVFWDQFDIPNIPFVSIFPRTTKTSPDDYVSFYFCYLHNSRNKMRVQEGMPKTTWFFWPDVQPLEYMDRIFESRWTYWFRALFLFCLLCLRLSIVWFPCQESHYISFQCGFIKLVRRKI